MKPTRFLTTTTFLLTPSLAAYTLFESASQLTSTAYDYLIAGGGLSGLIVANKLSKAGYTVLVIEAGPDARNFDSVNDALRRNEITAEQCNWKYTAFDEAGKNLSTLVDAGRCVGGSTSINGMVWFHPTTTELDVLETSFENPGWNAKNLLPYIKAIENLVTPTVAESAEGVTVDPSVHGTEGPVSIGFSTPLRIPSLRPLYKKAFAAVFKGIPVLKDLSDRAGSVVANTIWDVKYDSKKKINQRQSAAVAFLYNQPDIKSGKLTVLANTRVGKVVFDKDRKAYALEIHSRKGDKPVQLRALKEVILAAGSLQTPAILERSGYGSAKVLKKIGVTTTLVNEGVGGNLVDQPGTLLAATIFDQFSNSSAFIDGLNMFAPIISLANLDQLFGVDEANNLKWELATSIPDKAKAAVKAGVFANTKGATAVFNAAAKMIIADEQPVAEFVGESSLPNFLFQIFWPSLPLSRGSVHAVSKDPFDDPAIVPRFLTDEFDQKVAVQIMKKGLEVYRASSLKTLVQDEYVPGLGVPLSDFKDDAALLEYFKTTSYGASHWFGSCAMMPDRFGGVVGPDLKVYGTSRLRIVDGSLIPVEISSHTMPFVYAVASRAADVILGKKK